MESGKVGIGRLFGSLKMKGRFLISLCSVAVLLTSCKGENVEVVAVPDDSLHGTYIGTTTEPSDVYKVLLAGYATFKEEAQVKITQTGIDSYRLQITMKGVAHFATGFTPLEYGFNAEMSGKKMENSNGEVIFLRGVLHGLTPTNSELRTKEIEGALFIRYKKIEFTALIPFEDDWHSLFTAPLNKVK
jgi:hypothetical protein